MTHALRTLAPPAAAAQTEAAGGRDGDIFRWNGRDWTAVGGAAIRISVDPQGSPWVVNARGDVYRWLDGAFARVPGRAKDIGVGANGAVWLIGWDDGVYRWNGQGWDRMPGAAVAVSVQPDGAPWIVDPAGTIFRWADDHFERQSGRAQDLGAERSVWIIDPSGLVQGRQSGRWTPDDRPGAPPPGTARRICAGPDGSPWLVGAEGEIYRLVGDSYQRLPGAAIDIGVGADGSAWIVGLPSTSTPSAGGLIGAAMAGSPKKAAGPAAGLPPRSDAGPILGGPAADAPAPPTSAPQAPSQRFQYPPSVEPGVDAATFRFVTTQPTIPIIEISEAPPEPGPRFAEGTVVSAVFAALAGKQTRHELRVGNLAPRTHYYYIITIADEAGGLITETGELTTSLRID